LIKPVSRNGAILLALFLGYSIIGITVALIVGFGIGLVISIIVIRKAGNVAASMNISRDDITEFLRFSIPLTIQDSGSILYKQIDILMIGFLLVSADVSFFKIATVSTVYLILPLQALSQMFVPIASELYEKDNTKELNRLYHIVSRWALTASLFPAAAVIIFREELLTVFGSEYTAASFLVIIFVFRGIIINITGPSGNMLVMTNRQNYQVLIQWVFGVANVILNYILILQLGLIGAAIATTTTTILANISRVVLLWQLEDMHPYKRKSIKPFVAVLPAVAGMYLVLIKSSGVMSLVSGSVIGGSIYLTSIYFLGVEETDKKAIKKLCSYGKSRLSI
jgi:O-antigen/teichoic acid export membrane protein